RSDKLVKVKLFSSDGEMEHGHIALSFALHLDGFGLEEDVDLIRDASELVACSAYGPTILGHQSHDRLEAKMRIFNLILRVKVHFAHGPGIRVGRCSVPWARATFSLCCVAGIAITGGALLGLFCRFGWSFLVIFNWPFA